jgi:RNA polymerase sigma-70 factor (ECF subfamily)
MADETDGGLRPFPPTRWSLVGRANQDDTLARNRALGELLGRYLPALKAHLVFSKRMAPDRTDDLLQGFVSDKVLQDRLISYADPNRGKFRTFLLKALNNYVISVARHDGAQRRSPEKLLDVADFPDEAQLEDDPAHAFNVAWGREVLAEALRRMQAECQSANRSDIWGIFECRLLNPILNQTEPPPYEALVTRFGFQSPTQACNLLITGKRMFARLLRSVIQEYAADESEIDAEIEDLKRILSGTDA